MIDNLFLVYETYSTTTKNYLKKDIKYINDLKERTYLLEKLNEYKTFKDIKRTKGNLPFNIYLYDGLQPSDETKDKDTVKK